MKRGKECFRLSQACLGAIGLIFRALYSECEIKCHQKVHALKGSWEFGEGNFIQMIEIRACSEDSSMLLAGRKFLSF